MRIRILISLLSGLIIFNLAAMERGGSGLQKGKKSIVTSKKWEQAAPLLTSTIGGMGELYLLYTEGDAHFNIGQKTTIDVGLCLPLFHIHFNCIHSKIR